MKTVKTPHGEFRVARKDAIAISVIKAKRSVRCRGKAIKAGGLTTCEHSKLPLPVFPSYSNWATFVGAYKLNGEKIPWQEQPVRKVKSPAKLNGKQIDHLELVELPERLAPSNDRVETTGVQVTIFYQHPYLENPRITTATLTITREQVQKSHGSSKMLPTICDYFSEVGLILGLEDRKTVDWKLHKEIPDEVIAANENLRSENPQIKNMAASFTPGRLVWKADNLR